MSYYPKRITFSSRLPDKDENWKDCVREWCTARKGYFTMSELDRRDVLIKKGMFW